MPANDEPWERFFAETDALHSIETKGYYIVAADDLKRIGQREPRLLAKIDTLAERPKPFREHKLGIFPIRNGQYIVFRDIHDRSFYRFSDAAHDLPIEHYSSEVDLNAFVAYPGFVSLNESQAINFAFMASLLRTFTGDRDMHLAIRGRLYSGDISFYLPDTSYKVDVKSVQIEVDAGYESDDAIYLIEAKIGRRDDFHIRQLYYPYLEWSKRSRKPVIPIFLVYTNGKYYLTEFRFSQVFGELQVVKTKCFVINESPTPKLSVTALLNNLTGTKGMSGEPRVPYPQADDLDKVLDTVNCVAQGMQNKDAIAEFFEFDPRQGDYYGNAACYLGLLRRQGSDFILTRNGEDFQELRSLGLRSEYVARTLLERPTFREIFQKIGRSGFDPASISNGAIAAIIARQTGLTGTTPARRALTVRSWLRWLFRHCEVTN